MLNGNRNERLTLMLELPHLVIYVEFSHLIILNPYKKNKKNKEYKYFHKVTTTLINIYLVA